MNYHWQDKKAYKFWHVRVFTTKALDYDPVKWYTEVHKNGVYHSSYGSNLPFRMLAALSAVWKAREALQKERGGEL